MLAVSELPQEATKSRTGGERVKVIYVGCLDLEP